MVATPQSQGGGSLSPAFSRHPAQPLDYDLVTVRTVTVLSTLESGPTSWPSGRSSEAGHGHAILPLVPSTSPLGKTPLVRPHTMEYEEEWDSPRNSEAQCDDCCAGEAQGWPGCLGWQRRWGHGRPPLCYWLPSPLPSQKSTAHLETWKRHS